MDHTVMEQLSRRMEAGSASDPELVRDVLRALHAAAPGRTAAQAGALASTDEALDLAGQLLPLWTVRLDGRTGRSGGGWTCLLRETGVRDDDEMLGAGHAPSPALAIVAALLLTLARRRAE